MNLQLLKKLSLGLVLGFVSVISFAGHAQAQNGRPTHFEMPFAFHVGSEKYEAGQYTLVNLGKGQYLLRNSEKKSGIFYASTEIGGDSTTPMAKLVFNRYGNEYFLNQVYAQPNKAGVKLFITKAEKNVRKNVNDDENNLTKNKQKPAQVSVRAKN